MAGLCEYTCRWGECRHLPPPSEKRAWVSTPLAGVTRALGTTGASTCTQTLERAHPHLATMMTQSTLITI